MRVLVNFQRKQGVEHPHNCGGLAWSVRDVASEATLRRRAYILTSRPANPLYHEDFPMTEIQNCLPDHTRSFFIRLRNAKWEEARRPYQEKLLRSRSEAASRGVLRSGGRTQVEWDLSLEFIGNLAWGYFQAAVETCTLYEIHLTKQLCECIESAVKDFLLAQQRNAVNNAGNKVPGSVGIPLSSRQQLSDRPQTLPRYNDIVIALERARVESNKAFSSPKQHGSQTLQSMGEREEGQSNRPDVLNVLIASPGDLGAERDAAQAAIQDWNAVNGGPDTLHILLNPVRWETHSYPESGDRPQALLNRQIVERGDILIGIFGVRIGTPTGVAESGTIEEIEQFRQAGKYVALYFSNAPIPRDVDRQQLDALRSFQEARRKDTKYEVFSDAADLRRQLSQHLTGIVTRVAKPLQLGMWRNNGAPLIAPSRQKPLEDIIREQMMQVEEDRVLAQEAKEEASRWRPSAAIESRVEGLEQVNKLVLKSQVSFAVIDAALMSPTGVKLHEYQVLGSELFSTGFSIPVTHASLLKISNSSPSYFQSNTFQGKIRYSVVREKGGIPFSTELPFHAETVLVNSTLWFRLAG